MASRVVVLGAVLEAAVFAPFEVNDSSAFQFPSQCEKYIERRRHLLADGLENRSIEASLQMALTRGLEWNSLGVHFGDSWDFGSNALWAESCVFSRPIERAMMAFDHERRRPWSAPGRGDDDDSLASLVEGDGFARVATWGLSDAAVDRLRVAADRLVVRGSVKGVLSADLSQERLPDLDDWLQGPTLLGAIRGYLGPSFQRTSVEALTLTNDVERVDAKWKEVHKGYISAFWHHDRCGRRVKAFLFLNDVGHAGRPTLVAKASHRTLYFNHDTLVLSRFSDAYVEASYDVAAMTGPKGGGFLFDTNAVHRGDVDGKEPRTVIIADYIQLPKMRAFSTTNHTGPCGQPFPPKRRASKRGPKQLQHR